MSSYEIEEGSELKLDFNKLKVVSRSPEAVLPVVVQHFETSEVLILAYLSREALQKSIELGEAVFYSTSRKELWHKGSTSGDYLQLKEVLVNCEQNSLVFKVKPFKDGVCHTSGANGEKRKTCYYRRIKSSTLLEFIQPKEKKI